MSTQTSTQSGQPADGRRSPLMPRVGRYQIEPHGCAVTFRCRHLFGLGVVRGTISVVTGTVEIVEPAGCVIHVKLDAASFDTGNPTRDRQVRSARFLDAERHPLLVFTADRLDLAGENPMVTGALTVGQATRPVALTIDRTSAKTHAGGWFEVTATTVVDRVEFGLTAARGLAGRRLTVTARVRCVRS